MTSSGGAGSTPRCPVGDVWYAVCQELVVVTITRHPACSVDDSEATPAEFSALPNTSSALHLESGTIYELKAVHVLLSEAHYIARLLKSMSDRHVHCRRQKRGPSYYRAGGTARPTWSCWRGALRRASLPPTYSPRAAMFVTLSTIPAAPASLATLATPALTIFPPRHVYNRGIDNTMQIISVTMGNAAIFSSGCRVSGMPVAYIFVFSTDSDGMSRPGEVQDGRYLPSRRQGLIHVRLPHSYCSRNSYSSP